MHADVRRCGPGGRQSLAGPFPWRRCISAVSLAAVLALPFWLVLRLRRRATDGGARMIHLMRNDRDMDRTERLYKIDLLLNEQPHSFATLQDRLEVSRATLKRDLAYMKDRLNAPIVFDRFVGGYRFDKASTPVGDQYELPGLWFSAEEIHALLTMQHLLANLDTGGLLGPHIQPLLARLIGPAGHRQRCGRAIQQRIFVLSVGAASSISTTSRRWARRCSPQAPADRLLRQRQGRAVAAARGVAAAARLLPQQLVPRCVVPPAR